MGQRKDAEFLALLAYLRPTLQERITRYHLSHENSFDVAGIQVGLELLVSGSRLMGYQYRCLT